MARVMLHLWLSVAVLVGIGIGLSLIIVHMTARSGSRTAAVYRSQFADSQHERLFLASVAFFVTVVTVRTITLCIHFGVRGLHDLAVGGTHVHHLVWGIGLLLVVGYAWLAEFGVGGRGRGVWASRITAVLYGVGAALTLDEFALWLHLQDVYWSREGRESINALILFGGLLVMSVRGGPFFRALLRDVVRL